MLTHVPMQCCISRRLYIGLVWLSSLLARFLQIRLKSAIVPPRPSNISLRGKTYQLLQIETANLHVPLIVLHALGEALGIGITRAGAHVGIALVLSIATVGRGAVIHGSLLGRWGGAAAEHATDGVAD